MGWKIPLIFLVVLFLFRNFSSAFKNEMFCNIQINSNNLDGLGCAVAKLQTARGVKFDTQTEMCTELADVWFSSPNYDSQSNYFTITSTRTPLPKLDNFELAFPSNFIVEGSVIMSMEMGTVGTTSGFAIMFKNAAQTIEGFYMNMRQSENAIIYNTQINGVWGGEERKTNPFTISNKVYQLEFVVTTAQVKTYIDNVLFYSYNHRTAYSNYQLLHFVSDVSTCDQVQFTYP